ncbi:MAG: hypothetical protein ACYCYR_07790 [Desulfobulbaceae bacterium]|jgi:rRNA maturation protein Nop10
MTIEIETETLLCPHCGARLNVDNEMCGVCGKLMIAPGPPRHILRRETLVSFFSWLRGKFIRGVDHDKLFKEDPMIDPEFSFLSGNFYNDDEK